MEDLNFRTTEIQLSIMNVFNSDFSTRQISVECGISYTAVSELRNKKRDFTNASFDICSKLYGFAIKYGLTKTQQDNESRKGNYTSAVFEIPIKEVCISFENYDLFAHGWFLINNLNEVLSNKDKLMSMDVANTIVVLRDGAMIDAGYLGCRFSCRYNGNGPNNFVRFLKKYSKISPDEIRKTIFNSSVIRYDFQNDKLETVDSVFDDSVADMSIYSLNDKTIFLVKEHNASINSSHYNENEVFERILITIEKICHSMDKYAEDYLHEIKYVNSFGFPETKMYERQGRFGAESSYNIILRFGSYEIWIYHFLHNFEGFVWDDERMQRIIAIFNNVLPQYPDAKKITKFLNKKNPPISTLTFSPIINN